MGKENEVLEELFGGYEEEQQDVNEADEAPVEAPEEESEEESEELPLETDSLETETEEEEEPKSRKPKPDSVPIATLLEERREWKQKVDELQQKFSRYETLDERLKRFEEEREKAAAAEQEEAAPEFEFDPTGHLDHRTKKIESSVHSLQENLDSMKSQNELREAQQRLFSALRASESAVLEQNPDYYQALDHIRTIKRRELEPIAKSQGWDEKQVEAMIGQSELQTAVKLLQLGQDPAAYAYNMAKLYGYAPQAPEGAEELEKLERGQRMAKSIGSGAGKPRKSVDDIVNTGSMAEFDAAMAEMFPGYKAR